MCMDWIHMLFEKSEKIEIGNILIIKGTYYVSKD